MEIVFCLDYASNTERILSEAKKIIDSFKDAHITVVHVVNETLFFATTGFETQLGETLNEESNKLKDLCVSYLGPNVRYIVNYGIPRLKIDEELHELNYDLLVMGGTARQGLGQRLLGGVTEHILHTNKKPVLIIP